MINSLMYTLNCDLWKGIENHIDFISSVQYSTKCLRKERRVV